MFNVASHSNRLVVQEMLDIGEKFLHAVSNTVANVVRTILKIFIPFTSLSKDNLNLFDQCLHPLFNSFFDLTDLVRLLWLVLVLLVSLTVVVVIVQVEVGFDGLDDEVLFWVDKWHQLVL